MKIRIICSVLFIIAISWQISFASAIISVMSYDNEEYKKPIDQFSPQQKVYVHIIFEKLNPGKHNLTVDWTDPEGNVQSQSYQELSVLESGYYQQMFSLKLSRLGMFTRMFEGSSYPRNFLGKWTCRFMLNGIFVKEYSFTVR